MAVRRLTARLVLAVAFALAGLGTALAQDADPNAVLNLATNADPTLNPWTPGAVIESNLINTNLFDQLTRYSPEDLRPVPALATAWTPEEGDLAWVFELREGVQWSDGAPFGADDVAFTFNDVVLDATLGAQSATRRRRAGSRRWPRRTRSHGPASSPTSRPSFSTRSSTAECPTTTL